MWQYLETGLVVTAGGGDSTTGISGVEAMDALNQPVHRSADFPGRKDSPRQGNSNPLQYSCLGKPRDRGSWKAKSIGSQLRLNMRQYNSDLAENANSPEDEEPCCRAVLLDGKV